MSKQGEILDLGVAAGIVEKAGSWFSSQGERIGQGRENAKKFLQDNPEFEAKLDNQIRANAGLVADGMLAWTR